MNLSNDNIIGVVGGMGPQAGIALCNSILRHTQASTDQQHFSLVLMSFPRHIVDRTSYLEGNESENPAYSVVSILKKMEYVGVKIAGIACNTSHASEIFNVIMEELDRAGSQVKLLNMPQETCRFIKTSYPNLQRVGLMTTNGSYKSCVYEKLLLDLGYEVVIPDFQFQNNVIHKMIYDKQFGIKANPNAVFPEVKLLLDQAIDFFRRRKAEAIILGCTELSLLLADYHHKENILIIDSVESLALALIREATSKIVIRNDDQSELIIQ